MAAMKAESESENGWRNKPGEMARREKRHHRWRLFAIMAAVSIS
jgi:hypothetical protein